ncbi:MAG: protein kinase [Nannocystaceae bacterium]
MRPRSEGGTCRIYDAEHVQHGHPAVARIPRREVLRAHAWIAERMLGNAALLADAPHVGVVAIYDYGWTDEAEPRPFMITERIVGEDLAVVLEERGPLPWRQVVELARDIAGALHHFHGLGVVHGDLKPGNIMLTSEGSRARIKIIDPDLARRFDAPPDPGLSPGTPSYLAPEHVYGLRPGVKSDLFSLGVIFYELLVGECPIPGERRLRALQAGAPWPQLPALHLAYPDLGVPIALSRLISRLTSHDRALRPSAASEVVRELEGIGEGGRIEVVRRPAPGSSRVAPPPPTIQGERPGVLTSDLSHGAGALDLSATRGRGAELGGAFEAASRRPPSLLEPPRSWATTALTSAALVLGLLGWALVGALRPPSRAGDRASSTASEPMRSSAAPPTAERLDPVAVPEEGLREREVAAVEPSTARDRAAPVVVELSAPTTTRPSRAGEPRSKRRRAERPLARTSDHAPLPSQDEALDESTSAEESEASILAFRAAALAASRRDDVLLRGAQTSSTASRDPVAVPRVLHRSSAEAEGILAAVGLTASTRTIVHARCEAHPEGTVIAQDPAPGSHLDPDLPVILRVCGTWIAAE